MTLASYGKNLFRKENKICSGRPQEHKKGALYRQEIKHYKKDVPASRQDSYAGEDLHARVPCTRVNDGISVGAGEGLYQPATQRLKFSIQMKNDDSNI